MGTSPGNRLLGIAAALAAAGVCLLLLWSVRDDPRLPETAGEEGRGPAAESPGSGPTPERDGGAAAADDGAGLATVPAGWIRGTLVLPAAPEGTRVDLLLLAHGAIPAGRFELPAGPFDLELPDSGAPLSLVATAFGRKAVRRRVPEGGGHLGEIVLAPCRAYGGRLVDEFGRGVPGVVVHAGTRTSPPSREDGSFTVALPTVDQTFWPPHEELSFDAPGHYYAPVRAAPAGFRGEHLIRLEEAGSAPRMRLVRRLDGGVLAEVRWRLESGGEAFDGGRTDANGRVDPRWPRRYGTALLVVELPEGTVLVPLARDDAHGADRVDVPVPAAEEARRVTLVCVTPDGEPIAAARLRLTIQSEEQTVFLRTRSNGDGVVELRLDTPHDGPLWLAYLRAAWRDPTGAIRRREDQEGRELPPGEEGRLVLAPDESDAEIVWIRLIGDGADEVARANGSWSDWDPEAAAAGRRCPIASLEALPGPVEIADALLRPLRLYLEEPDGRIPNDTEIPLTVAWTGRLPVEVSLALGDLRRAAGSGVPLDVELPPRRTRLVRIADANGNPVPGAWLAAWETREDGSLDATVSRPAGPDGLVSLDGLPPGRPYSLVARALDGGATGLRPGWRPEAAPEITEIHLVSPEPLERTVRWRGEPIPGVRARLRTRFAHAGSRPEVAFEDGRLRTTPIVPGLWRLVLTTSEGRTLFDDRADEVPDPLVLPGRE